MLYFFFFSSRRRHTRCSRDWSSDVCSSDLREIPRFTPEAFAYLHNPNTAKFKQFRRGLDQLLQEGVIQVLGLRDAATKVPLLAAVGPLQFEVVQFRLESEYGAASRLESRSEEHTSELQSRLH